MLELNEPNKIKWVISYMVTGQSEPIIKGKNFDFIPEPNDYINLNECIYQVEYRIFDFEEGIILINLKQLTNKTN